MINGTEIDQLLTSFNENTVTLFIVTISILILTIYEMTAHPIWNWFKRPNLQFETEIDVIEKKDGEVTYDHVSFLIWIKNTGKRPANNCKLSMEFFVSDGQTSAVKSSYTKQLGNNFIMPVNEGDKPSETFSVYPNSPVYCMIPYSFLLARDDFSLLKKYGKPSTITYCHPPIENWKYRELSLNIPKDVKSMTKDIHNFKLIIQTQAISEEKMYGKHSFMLSFSTHSRITPNDIKFESMK